MNKSTNQITSAYLISSTTFTPPSCSRLLLIVFNFLFVIAIASYTNYSSTVATTYDQRHTLPCGPLLNHVPDRQQSLIPFIK